MVPHDSLQYAPGRVQKHNLPPGAIIQAAMPKPPKPPSIPDGFGDGMGGFGGGDDDDSYYDSDDLYGQFGSGGPATIGDLFTNVGLLLQRGAAALVMLWLLFVFVSCFCSCPGWLISTPVADDLGLGYDVAQFGPLVFQILTGILSMLIFSVFAAFFLPLRTYMIAGPDAILNLVAALKKIAPKIPGVLFFVFTGSIATTIGFALLIIPGMIIGALFTLATYLYVTYDQGIADAFREAFRMARNNIGPLIAATFVTFAVVLFGAAFMYGCISGIGILGSYYAALFVGVGTFITRFVTILILIVFWAATCITIETADTGIYIYKDEDVMDGY